MSRNEDFDEYYDRKARDARDNWMDNGGRRATSPFNAPPRRPQGVSTSTGHKETSMNFPGADKMLSRMFRRADGVVWDLMTGKIGVQTDEGIATLEGVGEEAQVNLNLLDDFGMALPAFAQATPKNGVQVGDIIYRGARNNIAWVIEKKEDGDKVRFKLMKPNGETASWNPPKVSLMGFESGVMVLRSLVSMLPGGQGDLTSMQGMLMPMMLMGGMDGNSDVMDKMMPLLLMQMMGGQGAQAGGMGNMMQMMMLMSMMKGGNSPFDALTGGAKKGGSPFSRG